MDLLDPLSSWEPTAGEVFRVEPFRERVYAITGAGQRIGEGMALGLGQLEGRLMLVDIDGEAIARVAETLEGRGVSVLTVVGDVAQRETIDAAVDGAMRQWGRIDGWLNNCGINRRATLGKQTDAEAEYLWQVNVEAARRAVQRVAPIMQEQGSGGIVNVSSVLAYQTRPSDATYSGTKASIEALTRGWALDLAPFGIRVNCLRPGSVELATAKAFDFGPGELGELRRRAYELRVRAAEPRQRRTLPRDVANAAIFLLSDMAAAITGAVLPVDGGVGVEFQRPRDQPERIKARRELTQVRERIRELEAQEGVSATD